MKTEIRLIELLEEAEGLVNNAYPTLEQIADHLIANGVIIPVRCKDCGFSKYFEESGKRYCRANSGLYRTVLDTDFCSYAERVVEDE